MEPVLVQIGADYAQAACIVGGTKTHLMFFGYIVKVEPLALTIGHNALGPDDLAVFAAVQRR